jgi:chromosome partitioning protein
VGVIRVLVANRKGGCGKTTIATNLASAFAAAGLVTALAEVDRQRSSLGWLAARPADAPPVAGLDWRKALSPVPDRVQRLVIDAPAALRMDGVDDLVRVSDVVLVPVLPSVFDEGSTRRFLERVEALKPLRKGKKGLLIIANRLRPRTRAAQRLERFLAEIGKPPAARLSDRSLYADLALHGLGLFDSAAGRERQVRREWQPLLGMLESLPA